MKLEASPRKVMDNKCFTVHTKEKEMNDGGQVSLVFLYGHLDNDVHQEIKRTQVSIHAGAQGYLLNLLSRDASDRLHLSMS